MLLNCYQSYYAMYIRPLKDGRAMVSTCCRNHFRRENRLIVEHGIKDAWNSKQFQFQRKLVSKKDWGFCRGACCGLPHPYNISEDNAVKNAIIAGKTKLDYFAKIVTIIPSSYCNNQCYFCYWVSKLRNIKCQLKMNLVKEIIEEIIPLAGTIILSGGEPFMCSIGRELINRTTLHHSDKKLIVITNGTLLSEFGIRKIIERNIGLRISMYGMNRKTYQEVTKTDNFDRVFSGINELFKLGYKNMNFLYLLSSKNIQDVEEFCNFIEKNGCIIGTVRNNFYDGFKYWNFMHKLEKRYSYLYPRLRFDYADEGSISIWFIRLLYNSWHSIRYFFENLK